MQHAYNTLNLSLMQATGLLVNLQDLQALIEALGCHDCVPAVVTADLSNAHHRQAVAFRTALDTLAHSVANLSATSTAPRHVQGLCDPIIYACCFVGAWAKRPRGTPTATNYTLIQTSMPACVQDWDARPIVHV